MSSTEFHPRGCGGWKSPWEKHRAGALLSAGNVTPYIGAACLLCLQALGITVSIVRQGLVCLHSSQRASILPPSCFHPASILPSHPAWWYLGRSGVLTLVGGCLPVPWNDI